MESANDGNHSSEEELEEIYKSERPRAAAGSGAGAERAAGNAGSAAAQQGAPGGGMPTAVASAEVNE